MRLASRRRLAVVIPALDEAEHLLGLVRRLLVGFEGEFARHEVGDCADLVVVADGGSQDGGPQLVLAAGGLVVEGARGRGAQLAAGAERALAELSDDDLLLFVHADNLPMDGALAALRRAAQMESGAVAWGCRQAVDGQGAFYRGVENLADRRIRRRGLVYGDSSLCTTVAAYRQSGGFLDLPLFEDVDLCRRLRKLGRVALVEDAAVRVNTRRWQSEGATVTVVRNWILTQAYWLGIAPRFLALAYPKKR